MEGKGKERGEDVKNLCDREYSVSASAVKKHSGSHANGSSTLFALR